MRCKTEEMSGLSVYQKDYLAGLGYCVECLVGSGAFGKVYRVWDIKDKRFLACKVAFNLKTRAILKREGEFQKIVTHPLFACYEDFLENRECSMLLMEYVDGENLMQYLKHRSMSQKQVVDVAIQLAEGIGYLHGLSTPVLYRDLKPENVCLTKSGNVRLMDLGCACKVSEAEFSRAGSPGYAPREQVTSIDLNVPKGVPGFYSDVYALGKLMHYMLTGDNPALPPYEKPSIRSYNRKFNPFLEQIIMRCTEEQVELRLPDMKCVLQKLRLFEAKGMGKCLELKRRELDAIIEGRFCKTVERGFLYERNVCCQAQKIPHQQCDGIF